MVIFHSYVSLPEGMYHNSYLEKTMKLEFHVFWFGRKKHVEILLPRIDLFGRCYGKSLRMFQFQFFGFTLW